MKPRVVKAWACGFCAKLFSHEYGKHEAEACCMCRTCGKELASYTGGTEPCTTCFLADKLMKARRDLKNAQELVERLERR